MAEIQCSQSSLSRIISHTSSANLTSQGLYAVFKSGLLPKQLDHNVLRATECNFMYSLEQEKPYVVIGFGYKLNAQQMHNPDYVVTVLVSIFISIL